MNKRDRAKLQMVLVEFTAHFSNPAKQSITIYRGAARAIVAAIREIEKGQQAEKRGEAPLTSLQKAQRSPPRAEAPQEKRGESWTERSRALGRAGFDGGNSGRQ